MQLKIRVHPNSIKFQILEKANLLHVYLENEAENNKANIELIKKLSKIFGTKVNLVSGLKSKDKVVEIGIREEQLKLFKDNLPNKN